MLFHIISSVANYLEIRASAPCLLQAHANFVFHRILFRMQPIGKKRDRIPALECQRLVRALPFCAGASWSSSSKCRTVLMFPMGSLRHLRLWPQARATSCFFRSLMTRRCERTPNGRTLNVYSLVSLCRLAGHELGDCYPSATENQRGLRGDGKRDNDARAVETDFPESLLSHMLPQKLGTALKSDSDSGISENVERVIQADQGCCTTEHGQK